jgi:predicted ABC-class ATPase
MQELVAKEREPITPFLDKVHALHDDLGVSTVLVIGGSGDYFEAADHVVCMVDYRPEDATARAKEIAEKYRAMRAPEGGEAFGRLTPRVPQAGSFDPSRGRREVKITPRGLQSIDFGTHRIDLGALEQLVHPGQTRAIGDAIHHATRFMDGKRTLREVVDAVLADVDERGLDVLGPWPHGAAARFRGLELAAAVNRLRTLRMRQKL